MSKDEVKVLIQVAGAYSEEVQEVQMSLKIYESTYIIVNDALDELVSEHRYINIDKYALSLYDDDLKVYIYLGIYPLETTVKVSSNLKNNEKILNIRIKSRPVLKLENLLRMSFIEDDDNEINEENQNLFISKKAKRSKERKISYIIEKVLLWRKLYNGITDDNNKTIKFTLEEAAEKVGISKKSLDDYLIQIRSGKNYGFNFNEHKNDKVGILRAFVKKKKQSLQGGKKKKIFESLNDSPNRTFKPITSENPQNFELNNMLLGSDNNTFNSKKL